MQEEDMRYMNMMKCHPFEVTCLLNWICIGFGYEINVTWTCPFWGSSLVTRSMVDIGSYIYSSSYPLYELPKRYERGVNTLIRTEGIVYHMEVDILHNGNLLLSDQHSLKTVNIENKNVLSVIGVAKEDGYAEGVGRNARFNIIAGFIQLLPSEIIVLDTKNHCIRSVDRKTQATNVIAGVCTREGYAENNEALFRSPRTIILDVKNSRQLIVTDRGNRALRTIDVKTHHVKNLFKNNDTSTETYQGILQDPTTGDIYFTFRHGIARFDYNTHTITHIAGSHTAGKMLKDRLSYIPDILFDHPKDLVTLGNGLLLVADSYNHNLIVLNFTSGVGIPVCSGLRGHVDGDLWSCQLWYPQALLLANNTVYVGETGSIRAINKAYLSVDHIENGSRNYNDGAAEESHAAFSYYVLVSGVIILLTVVLHRFLYMKYRDSSSEQVYDINGEVFGLILYNPDSRDGATQEAEDLHSGLQAVGCQVTEKMWTTKVELNNFIEECLYSIDECSLLVVCIMSHGTAGYLRCSDGDGSVVINDVLVRFSRVLPEQIPLVILVQACQQISSNLDYIIDERDMARRAAPEDHSHIVLDRSHTVLLLATMRGGYAKRSAYTSAIAEEFRHADGKLDVYDMHSRALTKMNMKFGDEQTPEIRSTLKKKLILYPK